MKEIPLTRGYVAVVDDADSDRVIAAGPWQANVRPHTVYAQRSICRSDGKRTSQLLHRFVLGLTNAVTYVDHRDFDGLNCTRLNLRTATPAQNSQHIHGSKSGRTSRFRGVHRRRQKYVAEISIAGRSVFLGSFHDEMAAARAYDESCRALRGEFATLNFPSPEVVGRT